MTDTGERTPILEVERLAVTFPTVAGSVRAVDSVSFSVRDGDTIGIVGESGCGKSVTARTILRLLPNALVEGVIRYRLRSGELMELASLHPDSARLREIRGPEMAMVFQEPMVALTPVYTIGAQIVEALQLHQRLSDRDARKRAVELLRSVGISDAASRVDDYPHQLSGGMRQRAMIAMALSCSPRILIADEPTTALDVTIQAQILELLRRLQAEEQMAVVLITHDLAVVAETCRNVVVMYLGRVVEQGPIASVFEGPRHPYTKGLLSAVVSDRSERQQELYTIPGTVPAPSEAPTGCRFRTRCPAAHDRCGEQPPEIRVAEDHLVECWLAVDQEDARGTAP